MQYSCWNKSQLANEDEVLFSALGPLPPCPLRMTTMWEARFSPGTPSSLPHDKVVSNLLLLYSNPACIKRTQQDRHLGAQELPGYKPKEQPVPSFFDNEILQPS